MSEEKESDIYAIAARVKNSARLEGGSPKVLTAVGESLCNYYIHVIKAFYDFAETIKDPIVKNDLISIIKDNESFPGKFIKSLDKSKVNKA